MATISSQLRMNDGMSPILRRMKQSMDTVIGSFGTMQRLSSSAVNTTAAEEANAEYRRMSDTMNGISGQLGDIIQKQQSFNSKIESGTDKASSLMAKMKGIVATLGVGAGISKLGGLSDDMAGAGARLSLIVDDGGSVDALKKKIFASSQDARGYYIDTMQTVSKLGLMAGEAFSGNDETIKFAELMNKNFIIAGSSAQEQSSAMYQLTQAMASGKLQGDEYRSIIENAPLLAKSIEQYMQNAGVEGTMKDWASDGMLTADVIKNALFSSADEIEQRFSKMPKTWGQIWTDIKNRAILALEPVLSKLNELANSAEVQQGINIVINCLANLAIAAMTVFEWISLIVIFFQENWMIIEPIVTGVAIAFLVYQAAVLAANIALGIMAVAQGLHIMLSGGQAGATGAATIAQWGLNTALYACPVFWIILLLGLLILTIYGVVAAINHVTGSTISATGIICGIVTFLAAAIYNIIIGLIDGIIQLIFTVIEPIIGVIEWVTNIFSGGFDNIGDAFLNLLGNLLSLLLSFAKIFTKVIDSIFGTTLTDYLNSWQEQVISWGKNEDAVTFGRMTDGSVRDFRWKYSDAWDTGYKFGEGVDKTVGGMFNMGETNPNEYEPFDYQPSYTSPVLEGIGEDTDTIASNTSNSDENLKILREIAEREAINKFTTAEVKVDMTGMSNNISADTDIDGFMNLFTGKLEEALLVSAEGVHA